MAQGVKKRIPVLFGVESFSGGVLRHVVDLALALDPEEFEVHLITSSDRSGGFRQHKIVGATRDPCGFAAYPARGRLPG